MKKTSLKYKPIFGAELIQKFINGVGEDIERYFGENKGCIIGLKDEGVFYGEALYQWLKAKHKSLNFTVMDDEGNGLEEEKLKECKVLIVDNDIITARGYKKATEVIRARKEKLKIKDIKYAVLRDRMALADFSVEGYSVYAPWNLKQLDGVDLKIIRSLSKNGRKSFVEIAKETGLSPVGIKNRVGKLSREKVLKIQGLLNLEKFYLISANINIEADGKTVDDLIEKFKKSPLVYHLVKTSGRYNLIISIVARDLESIENFVAKEIRANLGIKHIEVNVGELPIIPKGWNPPIL